MGIGEMTEWKKIIGSFEYWLPGLNIDSQVWILIGSMPSRSHSTSMLRFSVASGQEGLDDIKTRCLTNLSPSYSWSQSQSKRCTKCKMTFFGLCLGLCLSAGWQLLCRHCLSGLIQQQKLWIATKESKVWHKYCQWLEQRNWLQMLLSHEQCELIALK